MTVAADISSKFASRKPGAFIVLEGIDGSGKSTLLPLVCQRLRPPSGCVRPLSKKLIDYDDAYSREHLTCLRHAIWDEHKPSADVMGGEHWALLIASWYAVLQSRILGVATDTLVSDGWYFRNIVKAMEEHEGLDEGWLLSLFAPVRRPDAVVLVDVDPRVALTRGRNFDPRECGERALGGPVDFVTFQSRVRKGLLAMAGTYDWIVVSVAQSQRPDVVADVVAEQVNRRLGWSAGAEPDPLKQ